MMKKKVLLLAFTVAVAAGIGSAWATEPSHSYMDSLIRAGEPMEMKDGRRRSVDNPKLVPSQTAPMHSQFRGHGPAVMSQDKKDAPKDAPKFEEPRERKDPPKTEKKHDRKEPPKFEKKRDGKEAPKFEGGRHKKEPPKFEEKRDRKAPPKFEKKQDRRDDRKAPPHHREAPRRDGHHREAPPHHR